MIVSLDSRRFAHLLLLLGLSYAGGKLTLWLFPDWSLTAAFGLAITIVCQVNSAVLQVLPTSSATITTTTTSTTTATTAASSTSTTSTTRPPEKRRGNKERKSR